MTTISAIFIVFAVLNILTSVAKWIKTNEEQLSSIMGWICAILWCINANLN